MRRLILTNDMRDDLLKELVTFLNEIGTEDECEVWLSSDGGSVDISEAMRDILEAHENVTLVAFQRIGSSALNLFITCKCKKKVTEGTIGMFHLHYIPNVTLYTTGNDVDVDKNLLRLLKKPTRSCAESFLKIRKVISEKEVKDIKKNKLVYLDCEKIKKII